MNPKGVMSGISPEITKSESPANLGDVAESSAELPTRPGVIRKTLVALWKLIAGALLCQTFLGSVIVLGWVQRSARRATLKHWWRMGSSQAARYKNFESFALEAQPTQEFADWPNWVLSEYGPTRLCGGPRRWFGAFFNNARLGAQAILNTWVLTLPGCLLWSIAWYDGWQNSFNKGYEHAWVGPTTFGIGTILFIGAMFYVPLAQARQASTGRWRSFYDFKLIWYLIRRRWLASLGLAMVCAALSLPALVLKTWPAFMPQVLEGQILKLERAGQPIPPALKHPAEMTPAELVHQLNRFFFLSALYVFPAFVALRIVTARVYARGICDAIRSGGLTEDQLEDVEWQALHRLGLTQPQMKSSSPTLVRFVAEFGTRTGQLIAGVATTLVWLLFVVQVTTAEFFKYTSFGRGWWNQPLIQLPWFNYTPAQLEAATKTDPN